jgi:hypothetical protein
LVVGILGCLLLSVLAELVFAELLLLLCIWCQLLGASEPC